MEETGAFEVTGPRMLRRFRKLTEQKNGEGNAVWNNIETFAAAAAAAAAAGDLRKPLCHQAKLSLSAGCLIKATLFYQYIL